MKGSGVILAPIWNLVPFERSREQPTLCWRCSFPSPVETLRCGNWISLPNFRIAHLPCRPGLQGPGIAFHLTEVHTCSPVHQRNTTLGHQRIYVNLNALLWWSKTTISWDVMQCTLIEVHWCFRGTYCLYLQGFGVNQASSQQEAGGKQSIYRTTVLQPRWLYSSQWLVRSGNTGIHHRLSGPITASPEPVSHCF
jgi:hypothetical protein